MGLYRPPRPMDLATQVVSVETTLFRRRFRAIRSVLTSLIRVNPEQATSKRETAGRTVLRESRDKPHGKVEPVRRRRVL